MDINTLSNKIIGAAIEVHKILDPGLLESIYEECLCHELGSRNIPYERQLSLPIKYKDKEFDGAYRIDVLVDNLIILELKAVETIETIHKAQLLTYLKLSDINLGLLLNFNVQFLRDGIVRIVNNLDE